MLRATMNKGMLWLLRCAVLCLAIVFVARGNPVAIPDYLIEAENVLVGVTGKGAIVSGNYHFKWNKKWAGDWNGGKGRIWFDLPVPVSISAKGGKAIMEDVFPVVVMDGKKYFPKPDVLIWKVDGLPSEVKVAVFSFYIEGENIGEKVQMVIQYNQPVFTIDGKDMVYYIPFLPIKTEEGLPPNQQALLINFQSFDGVTLKLQTPITTIVQAKPTVISVRPVHREVIGVERVLSPK